ncbi:MAG: hypothetical protein AB8H86_30860 [Polyangiales bacterium]
MNRFVFVRVIATVALSAGCGEVPLFVSADSVDASVDVSGDGATNCGPPPPPQCVGTDVPRVCFENVTACAGGVVEIPVYVELDDACPQTLDQGGGFVLAPFELANPRNIDSRTGVCLRREVVGESIEWAQLSSATISQGCPDSLAAGVVDVLRLRVPADTAPGDYRPRALWGLIQSTVPACATMRPVQTPLIRVVAR